MYGVQDGRSVMHKFRLDEEARQGPPRAVEAFVGGLWQHLQSLLLYTLPSPASAMRAQPGSFCGVYRHAPCCPDPRPLISRLRPSIIGGRTMPHAPVFMHSMEAGSMLPS